MMTGLPCTAVRPSAAPPEDEESSGDRVLIEACFAEGDERINSLAKVDGLDSQKDPTLGGELEH